MDRIDQEIVESLMGPMGLETVPDQVRREVIVAALAQRLGSLLESNPDYLLSLLYRLDITEKSIKGVWESGEDFIKGIAGLVYDRQVEKCISRKKHGRDTPDEELAW